MKKVRHPSRNTKIVLNEESLVVATIMVISVISLVFSSLVLLGD